MANVTLAQHEQLLKQLEHSLNEIGDQHQFIHDSLNEVWSKVVNLFATVEKIRRTRLEFEKETL